MKRIIMLLMCLTLSGCTESKIVAQGRMDSGTPDIEYQADELDMEQLHADVCDIIYSEDYPVIQDIYFDLNMETEKMYLDIVVHDDSDPTEILQCPVEVIKTINDCAALQKPEYGVSSDTSYGEVFDYVDIYLRIYYEHDYPDGECILQDVIARENYIEYEI